MIKPTAALLCLTLAACATQIGMQNATDRRITMFSQVVFAPDYDSRRSDYLAKWTTPVRIVPKGALAERYKGSLKGQAESMTKMTGHDVALTTESKPSNVTVYFATLGEMEAIVPATSRGGANTLNVVKRTGCHYEVDKNASHRITGGRLYVQVNPGADQFQLMSGTYNTNESQIEVARVNRCLVKGLLQLLGMENASDVVTPSIFNSGSTLAQPTSLDLKMIQTLYKPSLKPGMPRREALAVANGFLEN